MMMIVMVVVVVVIVLNKAGRPHPHGVTPRLHGSMQRGSKSPPTCPPQRPFIVSVHTSTHQKNLFINPQTDRMEVNSFCRWKVQRMALQLSASVRPHVTFQLGTCSHENRGPSDYITEGMTSQVGAAKLT